MLRANILREPTTVAGISGIVGTVYAAAVGQITWATAIPLLVGSVVAIILPDSSTAKVEAADVATQLIKSATTAHEAIWSPVLVVTKPDPKPTA